MESRSSPSRSKKGVLQTPGDTQSGEHRETATKKAKKKEKRKDKKDRKQTKHKAKKHKKLNKKDKKTEKDGDAVQS